VSDRIRDPAYEAIWSGGQVDLDQDVIEVRGPDAATYLQGQLSQDVAALAVADVVVPSLLLEPSGKLGFLVGLCRLDDASFFVTVDRPSGGEVVARLERFKLRTDVEVRLTEGEWHVVAALDTAELATGGPALVARVLAGAADLDRDRLAAYDVARVELGVPTMRSEVRGELIPAELGQPLIHAAASFSKGCYTGQELVARVEARGGNVPRHLRGLVVEGDRVPSPGDELIVDGKVVGELTSAAWSPRLDAPVALALVHRSVEVGAVIALKGSSDTRAEVRDLPLVASPS